MQSYMTFLMTLKKIQNNFVCIAYSHVWATIACQVKVPCVVGCSLVFCVCHVSFEINRISIWHKPKSTKSVRIVQCGCGWALVQLSPPGLSTEIVVVLMLHLISIGIKSNNSLPSRLLRIVQRQIYVNNDGTGSGHPLFLWFLCFVRYSKQKWSSRNQMLLTCGKYNEQKQFTKLWCHLNNLRLDMWAWKIFSGCLLSKLLSKENIYVGGPICFHTDCPIESRSEPDLIKPQNRHLKRRQMDSLIDHRRK